MQVRRWTPFVFMLPGRYLETDRDWTAFDLEDWAREEYEWTEDPWNGFLDFATPVEDTIDRGRGDCEDFALVAVSWAVETGRPDVGMGLCWEKTRPWPTHVIGYDADYVYSSGHITETSVGDWLSESKYSFVLRRRVA